jgi:putative ATPase
MAKKAAPPMNSPTLLQAAARRQAGSAPPLADRMRPQSLEEVVGQKQLLREGKLLREVIAKDRVPSLILWGPPGSGKTTLANVISQLTRAEFVRFSAVLGGLPELRELLAAARERRAYQGVLAARRGRHHHVDRRDHGESVVRRQRGGALARPRIPAGSAG